MVPIAALNALSRVEFAEALRPLLEAATPLADALYAQRPFTSYGQLIDAAEALAVAMPFHQQVEVLAAHPRIGAPVQTLSEASRREQSHGTQAAEWVAAELTRLNDVYEERFGFRFVVFVNKRPRAEILDVLKQRLARSRNEELRAGLRDMFLIARDRLIAGA